MQRTHIRAAGLLLLASALAGCGQATPSPTSPADRFVAAISDADLKLTAAIEGTFTLAAGQEFPVHGVLAIDGPDSRTLVTIEEPLGITAWEQIVRDGQVVVRRDAGDWSDPVKTADEPPEGRLRAALASVTAIRDLGEGQRGGKALHRLRADALAMAESAVGFEVTGGAPAASLEAWVGDDGIPVELRIDTPTLALTITPTAFGSAAPIPAPYELTTFRSNSMKYVFVHPKSWEVTVAPSGSGHQFGLDGAFIVTYCVASTPRISLDFWTREGILFYGNTWDAKPDEQRSVVVKAAEGPVRANIVAWHGTAGDKDSYILDLAIVTRAVTCDIQWFSPPGHEVEDRARFEQFIAASRLGE